MCVTINTLGNCESGTAGLSAQVALQLFTHLDKIIGVEQFGEEWVSAFASL